MTKMVMHLSTPVTRVCQTKEKALHDWHAGEKFKIYQSGGADATCNDTLRMRMAGFTHVVLVWQDVDLRVHGHEIELT